MGGIKKVDLNWEDCRHRANLVASDIIRAFPTAPCSLYGVPRGGIHAALLVQGALHHRGYYSSILEEVSNCHCVVDDIIDSGRTRDLHAGRPFFALVDKQGRDKHWLGSWLEFPWERMDKESTIQDNIVRILEWIGEDPNRDGLKETPDRVIRGYTELLSGYQQDPKDLMKIFDSGGLYDEMILLKSCEFISFCEHHILPFSGYVHVAYLPEGNRVIGLSKLARLIDIYAKRLQLQERLTSQITKALDDNLKPKGSACVIEATHACMSCRGAKKQNASMVTSSLTGAFRRPEVRSEFFHLIK